MGSISDIFLPIALAFIMFSLGLGLAISDFSKILMKPKIFLIGAFSQIFILPIVALIIVFIWPISQELAIGVMLIAAAPGGATSNIITSFAKGDVALSVSLTAIISLLSVITIPIIILISLNIFTDKSFIKSISILNITIQMFLIITVPVIFGMIFKIFFIISSTSIESISKKLSVFFFDLVLLGVILSQKENIFTYFYQSGLITLTLNITMMLIAFLIGIFFSMNTAQRKTITIECGLQNGTVAIVVATLIFPGETIYLIPAATYSIIMFATSLMYILFLRKID